MNRPRRERSLNRTDNPNHQPPQNRKIDPHGQRVRAPNQPHNVGPPFYAPQGNRHPFPHGPNNAPQAKISSLMDNPVFPPPQLGLPTCYNEPSGVNQVGSKMPGINSPPRHMNQVLMHQTHCPPINVHDNPTHFSNQMPNEDREQDQGSNHRGRGGRGNWRGRNQKNPNEGGSKQCTGRGFRGMMPRNPNLAKSNTSVFSNASDINHTNESGSRPPSRSSFVSVGHSDSNRPHNVQSKKRNNRNKRGKKNVGNNATPDNLTNDQKFHTDTRDDGLMARNTQYERRGSSGNNLPDETDNGSYNMQRKKSINDEYKSSGEEEIPLISEEILIDLLEKDSLDILSVLSEDVDIYSQFLSEAIEPKQIMLIVRILGKICAASNSDEKAEILRTISQSAAFLDQLFNFMDDLPYIENAEQVQEIPSFISNVIILYETLSDFIPSGARIWRNHFLQVKKSMNASVKHLKVHLDSHLFNDVELLINDLTNETGQDNNTKTQENVKTSKNKNIFLPEPVGDFRTVSVYPRPEDVFNEQPFLQANVVDGPYGSIEHYLDTHFKLLREDFMSPIRKALRDFKRQLNTKDKFKRIDNVRIYRKVKFLHPKTIFDKVGYEVNFDVDKKINRVNWEYSNRFMFGSLLLFTNDNFDTFFLATVANRNVKELEAKRVVVELKGSLKNAKSILGKEFIMAESEAYFEPYFNVLNALQMYNDDNFPLAKYIVEVNTETEPPNYLNEDTVYNISMNNNVFNFRVLSDVLWPTHNDLGLDPSQYQAFKAALTNDLVVIQGPPGTGKTFLGLKIAQGLLANAHVWNVSSSPIFVVCFTNHALDQFLEGLLPFTRKLVRIGGKSKGSELDKFNIRERRKEHSYYRRSKTNDSRALQIEMSKVFAEIKAHQTNLQVLDDTVGVLCVKSLQLVMGDLHREYFRSDADLIDWLLIGVGSKNIQQDVKVIITADRGIVKQSPLIDPNVADAEDLRVKQALFDTVELLDVPVSEDTVTVHFSCNLNEIKGKLEEYKKQLNLFRDNKFKMNRGQFNYLVSTVERLEVLHTHLQKELVGSNNLPGSDFEKTHLLETYDLGSLDPRSRWKIYHTWVDILRNGLIVELGNKETQFRTLAFQYEQIRQTDDINILKTSHVVGTTTTLAAKYRPMFAALAPKIVIVEEAAEALEAHVIASLPTSCEHLILIGDHKQLRPSVAEVRLARQYELDISLFERMVNNGMACHTLTLQHRMRPEVSKQLVPTIYPRLYDHESVLERDNIKGMDKNVFFMTHNHYEDDVVEITSKRNQFEAAIMLKLANYLVQQGYKPQEITILATYKGQMYHMKNELKNMNNFPKGIQITVVDNFQGEENKIILLSLVRSNKMNKIGFLEIENRVCVALSRARDALYIIGNMDCLVASSEIWPHIKQSLVDQHAYGTTLRLRCQVHPDQVTNITSERDFSKVSEGGCSKVCGEELPCGHNCKSMCHISPDYHRIYKCKEPCPKILCQDGHQCPGKCFMKCGPCVVPMKRHLICGHEADVPCHIDVREYPCTEQVQVEVSLCGHTVIVPCHSRNFPVCNMPCRNRLECGHSCDKECHVDDDPDHLQFVCTKACPRLNKGCSQDHKCALLCCETCVPCPVRVEKHLPCGHSTKMLCSTNLDTYHCKRKCERILDCGHKCTKLCWEPCQPCLVLTEKVVPECGHNVKIECREAPVKALCQGPCANILDCGHICKKRCCDPCLRENCIEPRPFQIKTQLCGHENAEIPCNKVAEIRRKWSQETGSSVFKDVFKGVFNWKEGATGRGTAYSASNSEHCNCIKLKRTNVVEEEELLQYCSEFCGQPLPCKHTCSGTCSDCMQGRIHKMCNEPCGNVLICGHSCPVPCREVCPPCNQPCRHECIHSKCTKKCGEVCVMCTEKCDYSCPHLKCTKKCGELCDRPPCYESCDKVLSCDHPCVGFCGEPCPPCRECEPEHFEEFFYTGEETEDDAKWVYLEDCKHTLETGGLEYWLKMKEEGGEIVLKTCPKCKSPIVKTQRFMNLIKETYIDIQKIKQKCYGKASVIKKNRMQSLRKIQETQFFKIPAIYDDQLEVLYKKLTTDLPEIKMQRKNAINSQKVQLLCFFTEFFVFLHGRRQEVWDMLNDESRNLLTRKINHISQLLLKRSEKISEPEIKSFELELNRIHRLCDLLIYTSSYEYRLAASQAMTKGLRDCAENIIHSVTIYTDDVDEKMKEVLGKLKEHIKSATTISDAERNMIHKAMMGSFHSSQKSGHWFKCKNGHPYCITECGGAMVEAVCPIDGCGEIIGGRNHTLRPDQSLASEMDGAAYAAWSDMNNMANFGFQF